MSVNQVALRGVEEPVSQAQLPIEESFSLTTSDKYSDTPSLGAPTGAVMQSPASPRGFVPSPLLPLSMLIFAVAPKPATPKGDMLTPFSEGQELEKDGDWLKKKGNSAGAAKKYKAAAEKFKTAGIKPAHARALIKWASSYEEALGERSITNKWGKPEAIYQQAAFAFREILQQRWDKKDLEIAKDLLLFAVALEGSGQDSWKEAQKVYEESARLFFELDDPAGARLAASDALIIAEKRNDLEGRVSLLELKGDISLALGEYQAAAKSYGEAEETQAAHQSEDANALKLLAFSAEKLSWINWGEGLKPLGSKAVAAFKILAAGHVHFRRLSADQMVKVAKDIAAQWEAEKTPGAAEISSRFIRTHYPTVKKGEELLAEGRKLVAQKKLKYGEAEMAFHRAAKEFSVARLYDREAEARHLQLEALDAIVGRQDKQDKEFRADIVAQEIAAWDSAAKDATEGLEAARFLGREAYALIAAGRVKDAARIIRRAHSVNVREGTHGLEANARMHEKFGKLLNENNRILLAVGEFETAAQARYMLKQFTRAARLYGRIGDLISLHKISGKDAIHYYDLAIAAAAQGRDGELSWRYSRKKINRLLAMGEFVEAAELADDLLKRRTKSDRVETALDLKREAVRRILQNHVDNPRTSRESVDEAWDVFSSLRKREGFSRLSERDQWRTVHESVVDWGMLTAAQRGDFADVADYAGQSYEAAKSAAAAEGVEARNAESGREEKEGWKGKEARGEEVRGEAGVEGRPVK